MMNQNDTDPAMQSLISNLKRSCTAALPLNRRAEISSVLSEAASQPPRGPSSRRLGVRVPRMSWLGAALGRRPRIAAIGITCLLIALSGLTIALAASPSVREALGLPQAPVTVETLPGGTGLAGVYPGIPHVANPNYIPPGLTAREFAYYPAHTSSGHTRSTILTYDKTSNSTAPGADILWQEGVPAVYEGFFSPKGGGYAELLERSLEPGQALPAGQTISLAGTVATIHQEGAVTVVALARSGTLVTVRTNLGQPEALKVAGSLQ